MLEDEFGGEEGFEPDHDIKDIDFIFDLTFEMTVELGGTQMRVKDLLKLGRNSVVELEKLAGEPLEIYVNKMLVARGEVVIVNEKFGVRISEMISPMERMRILRDINE